MQNAQSIFYLTVLALGALIPGGLMIYAWGKRGIPGASPFASLMLFITIWGGSYFLSVLAGDNLQAKIFWSNLEYIGVVMTPVVWLIFAIEYSGQKHWFTHLRLFFLSLIPILSLTLIFTNSLHKLFFTDYQAVKVGTFWVLASDFGPFFWLHAAYTYLLILVGFTLILRTLARQIAVYRAQLFGILIGLAAPLISSVITITGVLKAPVDLTPFSFSITGLVMAWTLFRFRLFDLSPIARDMVIESMPEGMIILDAQNRVVDLNAAASAILGLSSSQIVGYTVRALFRDYPELIERYRNATDATDEIALGEPPNQRHYELHLSALRTRQGQLVGRVITAHDITTRKEAEQTVRLQAAALDAAANAIIITDRNSSIQWVNPAFTALTGYTAEEALHQPTSLLRSGKHDETFYQHLWHTINSGKIWRGEIINRRKDGTHYIEYQTITPLLNEKGEVFRFIAIKQDITELINTRDQALEASRFKSELLARVSHELRTPLGAIIGYAELLYTGLYGDLTGEQKEVTLEVVDSAKHLTQMVNELLEEAQLDAHAIKLYAKPFAPRDMLQTVATRMSVLAQNKGLILTTSLALEVPATLLGDQPRLQQILINLVGNAIKFTPTGTISVKIYLPDPSHWAIDVQDTGPGIPIHAQKYIFEPFRQLDGTMTREHGGSGLGLSIAKRLIELMGGEITLASTVGQGSCFTVYLPLKFVPETTT